MRPRLDGRRWMWAEHRVVKAAARCGAIDDRVRTGSDSAVVAAHDTLHRRRNRREVFERSGQCGLMINALHCMHT